MPFVFLVLSSFQHDSWGKEENRAFSSFLQHSISVSHSGVLASPQLTCRRILHQIGSPAWLKTWWGQSWSSESLLALSSPRRTFSNNTKSETASCFKEAGFQSLGNTSRTIFGAQHVPTGDSAQHHLPSSLLRRQNFQLLCSGESAKALPMPYICSGIWLSFSSTHVVVTCEQVEMFCFNVPAQLLGVNTESEPVSFLPYSFQGLSEDC